MDKQSIRSSKNDGGRGGTKLLGAYKGKEKDRLGLIHRRGIPSLVKTKEGKVLRDKREGPQILEKKSAIQIYRFERGKERNQEGQNGKGR